MRSQFRLRKAIDPDQAPWGYSRWISHPGSTGGKQAAVLDASMAPGQGHAFHVHPHQEEILCLIEGEIEQWIEREKRTLVAGDALFIAPGTVHATFNTSDRDARLIVIFCPCVGDGFETIEVAGEKPWLNLRH